MIPNRWDRCIPGNTDFPSPTLGKIVHSYPAGSEPRFLALSDDNSRLYYSTGFVNNRLFGGFSFTSEVVRNLDLSTGTIGPNFGAVPPRQLSSYGIVDLAVLQGQPQSVAILNDFNEMEFVPGEGYIWLTRGSSSIRIYDNGQQRRNILTAPAFECTSIQPGPTESRLYCATGERFSKLNASPDGISLSASAALGLGNVAGMRILLSGGRIFTTTGLVIDPESMQVIARVPAQGPVAVDGGRVYWLDPGSDDTVPVPGQQLSVTLHAFNSATLRPIDSKKINVTARDVTRLIPCGPGCLAFRSGQEIYLVDTDGIVDSITVGTHSLSVAGNGGVSRTTGGQGTTAAVGYASIQPELGYGPVAGVGIFGFRQNGVLVTEASVPASGTLRRGRIYAEMNGPIERGSIQTGVAVTNTSAMPARVLFELINMDGIPAGPGSSVSIPANGQFATFLNQVSGLVRPQTPFQGILRVSSSSPISVLGLRGRYNERGDFLITTVPPANEGSAAAQGETLYFPHVVDSGGYTTQFVLINPASSQPAPGTLRFFSSSGQAMDWGVQ